MVLPDFNLPTRSNQCWEYSGMDCLQSCLDKKQFKSYLSLIIFGPTNPYLYKKRRRLTPLHPIFDLSTLHCNY